MGRHSRKGRAPKGDTNDMRTARTATSAGPDARGPAAPRGPEAQGFPGAQSAGGPVVPGARRGAAAPAGPPGAWSPGGAPPPRGYDGAPGQGAPRFTGGAPGQQGPRPPDGTPAHGFPRLPDGTPAHGMPRFADGTPAHGFPRLPDDTSARGFPPSRGGHPEQREAGGGWGHLGGGGRRTGAGHGVAQGAPEGAPYGVPGEAPPPGAPYGEPPERSGRRIPIPRQRQEAMPPGGPRQAYLDAFDEVDDVHAPGRTHRAAPGADADGRAEAAFEEQPSRETPLRRKRSAGEPPGDGSAAVGTAKGGKGRAFAGIAAAAVTTVLVVVAVGRMAGGDDSTAPQPQAADAGERDVRDASRSDNRPTPSTSPSPGTSATPLSYDQKMGQKYALAADLEGDGKFEAVKGFDKAPGAGQKYRYRVDVEEGLGLDAGLFADAVQKTLNDDRSWAHNGGRTFERISSGTPDFVITLASPGTTAFWCAKSGLDTTVDNVSCDSASTERVMINAYRWAQGAETYGDQIHAYRQMLINHEIGHRLRYDHVTCDKNGELAPVMQQQSKFLTYKGITCKANPWPYPGS
ncbi:DUF3152 domain-containing protein [Streptomyces griseiscabiei]|uniref:DUF3152 domain-containing protein n=2 Tax=Streptomyces griseiscabiei TaxID=2993540 RepID=A0ABU4L9M7_9ACTN|nr:DUF3152 domain-containing protein [Streptomyces griseiscabiei]MBZ3903629.1 DUF3152 domain-containing protein [Streptomyces griseiscabiei]MDX2912373.1 DUF3152 domain-containing protein [Streptomyces griseiscabiei]